MELKFKPDKKQRVFFFTGLSFSHPAKMVLPLQLWLVENFTSPGDVILDPMAGSGTVLVACTMGRDVICVELEKKFCDMMEGNWRKIQERGAQMGYSMGWAKIINGDARNLGDVLADKIISSPPYMDSPIGGGLNTKPPRPGTQDQHGRSPSSPSQSGAGRYSDKPDVILTSPPYAESKKDDKRATNPEQIDKRAREFERAGGNFHTPGRMRTIARHYAGYTESKGNIGNLKADSYLAAMKAVYSECFRVLKNGGLMCLVTKNFLRNRKEIRLDSDTIRLAETAGFIFKERHFRRLTSQSFWRVIYARKYPTAPVLDTEDILIFTKVGMELTG